MGMGFNETRIARMGMGFNETRIARMGMGFRRGADRADGRDRTKL
jgi:hypothetical protein